jgi:bacterioferritin-associated ferredoxin
MRIDRCICADVTFAEALQAARADGLTLADLQRRFGCSASCGMCGPYLRRTLRTGETVFHQIVTEREEPAREGEESRTQQA